MIKGAQVLMMGLMLFFATGYPSNREVTKEEILTPESDREFVRARATRLWQAKVLGDWDSVMDFYEPQKRTSYSEAPTAEYGTEPVSILSFNVQNVVTENDFGWAWVEYNVTLLRYDTLVPITMQTCEKWRRMEGNWYLIPTRETLMYPESPNLRDRTEEAVLRAQFEKSWAARRRSNWASLYRMIDLRNHKDTDFDSYVHSEDEFKYLKCKVGWVEVIGDSGRVLATYNRRVITKKLKKQPPHDATIIEQWTRINGKWYLALK